MIQNYNVTEIQSPTFVDELMRDRLDHGKITVTLPTATITLPARLMILNILCWRILFRLKVCPTKDDVIVVAGINEHTFSMIHSKLFTRLLAIPDLDPTKAIHEFSRHIEDMERFTKRYCGRYIQTIDAIGLCKLLKDPTIKAIVGNKLDPKLGTKIAEEQFKQISKDLVHALGTRGMVKENILINFMETGSLRDNQIPQVLAMYATRSDINDEMVGHIINESTLSGLRTAADYAVEALSAKKSSYFSKVVIQDSQYFARRLRLSTLSLPKIHPGSCGRSITIPINIPESRAMLNFLDKIHIENGKPVVLTRQNLKKYVGKTIQMITPMGCRYTDGTCEACAGKGNVQKDFTVTKTGNVIRSYLPKNIHIGVFAATQVGQKVSQMVLSAKHLIKTLTKEYNLTDIAKLYLFKKGDTLYWNKPLKERLQNLYIRFNAASIVGPVTDLTQRVLPTAETYSRINNFEIVEIDEVGRESRLDVINMESNKLLPFLSNDMLHYMRHHYDKIIFDDATNKIAVPLHKFDMSKGVMKYIIVNDDMITFTENVDQFFSYKMSNYTSIAHCLTDFINLLYSKTNINIFFVEMVLRAFMISPDAHGSSAYKIPAIEDPMNVRFGNMSEIITNRDVSTKLGYERVTEYLSNPTIYTKPRGRGYYDPFFGIGIELPKTQESSWGI